MHVSYMYDRYRRVVETKLQSQAIASTAFAMTPVHIQREGVAKHEEIYLHMVPWYSERSGVYETHLHMVAWCKVGQRSTLASCMAENFAVIIHTL